MKIDLPSLVWHHDLLPGMIEGQMVHSRRQGGAGLLFELCGNEPVGRVEAYFHAAAGVGNRNRSAVPHVEE
jgi:hypothetical protein